MASEYLVLTDIASNLSTYVQNVKVSSSSTSTSHPNNSSNSPRQRQVVPPPRTNRSGTIKDDAKLLLNLKEIALVSDEEVNSLEEQVPGQVQGDSSCSRSRKTTIATTTMFETSISPSLSFEAKRHYETQAHSYSQASRSEGFCRPSSTATTTANNSDFDSQQCDAGNTFSLSCPSLSLKDNRHFSNTATESQTKTQTIPIETTKDKSPRPSQSKTTHAQAQAPTQGPPQLFARPITKRSSLDVTDVAEALASNVLQSFITALEWRTKVWIADLARSLSSKFKDEASKLKPEKVEKDGKKRSCGKQSKSKSPSSGSNASGLDKLREKFKKSQEARVIEALSQTKSSIIVHDVRTTFFVLEQQLNTAPIDEGGEEEKKEDYNDNCPAAATGPAFDQTQVFRPLKKRRTVTDDEMSPAPQKATVRDADVKYTLSHALNLDSRCSVSTSSEEKMSVSLQTPGVIDGTFVRNGDGDVMLVDVSIRLDTECLALSMEQKSRLVVRKAAEECIVSPPSATGYNYKYAIKKSAKGIVASDDARVPGNSSAVSADEGLYHHHDNSYGRRQNHSGSNSQSHSQQYSSHSYPSCSPFTPQRQSSHTATPQSGIARDFGDSTKALVTPNDRDGYGSTSDDSEGMPPPPPRLPLDGNSCNSRTSLDIRTSFLNPRRVSPTADSNASNASNANAKNGHGGGPANSHDMLNSPTPSKVTILAPSPSATKNSAHALPLVSPHATFNEGKASIFIDGEGPLLPALLEAASAMCN